MNLPEASLLALHASAQAGVAAGWLPAMLHYGFVVNALLAGVLLGPLLGTPLSALAWR